jgi:hypothetical protein
MIEKQHAYVAILVGVLCFITLPAYKFFNNFLQHQIERYMRFALQNQNIVVSMTTTPQRILQIEPYIQTILNQNVTISKVYLNIPHKFKRNNSNYDIPEWLKQHPKITILRTMDYGPATKLLGLLEQIQLRPDDIIITLDDDAVYPSNLVLHLAYKSLRNPKIAVGASGANIMYDANNDVDTKYLFGLEHRYKKSEYVDVLQGYAGIAYRAAFFDNSIFALMEYPPECIASDDLYFAFYLAQRKIERYSIQNGFINAEKINWRNPLSTSSDALHRMQPRPSEKHRTCLAFMRQLHHNAVL